MISIFVKSVCILVNLCISILKSTLVYSSVTWIVICLITFFMIMLNTYYFKSELRNFFKNVMCVRKLLCFFIVLSPLLDYSSTSMFCSVIFLRIWLILCTWSCVRIWICPIVSLGQWKTCTHLYFHKGYLLQWPLEIHHNFIAILRAISIFFFFFTCKF